MNRYNQSGEPFMHLLRALAETWQGFERYAGEDIRTTGLSAPQFDVVCTLGNTTGMTFTELGDRTLIYKTTLTGVVDRLEQKGLVERCPCSEDRRRIYVRLTSAGNELFERVFPAHVKHLRERLGSLSDEEIEQAIHLLSKVRRLL